MDLIKKEHGTKRVCILGTGWIGSALAEFLRKESTKVYCSASDDAKLKLLADKGFAAFKFNPMAPMPDQVLQIIQDSDYVVITYPPKVISTFLSLLKSPVNYPPTIYLSSTSVYPEKSGVFSEEMAENRISPHSGVDLLATEQELMAAIGQNLTILRLAGLFGPGRFPGKFIDASKPLINPDTPVNMVHQEDVVRAIEKVIERDMFGQCFNVCAPVHPTRLEFYSKAIFLEKRLELHPGESTGINRVISGDKLIKDLGFEFKHENPLLALDQLIHVP